MSLEKWNIGLLLEVDRRQLIIGDYYATLVCMYLIGIIELNRDEFCKSHNGRYWAVSSLESESLLL